MIPAYRALALGLGLIALVPAVGKAQPFTMRHPSLHLPSLPNPTFLHAGGQRPFTAHGIRGNLPLAPPRGPSSNNFPGIPTGFSAPFNPMLAPAGLPGGMPMPGVSPWGAGMAMNNAGAFNGWGQNNSLGGLSANGLFNSPIGNPLNSPLNNPFNNPLNNSFNNSLANPFNYQLNSPLMNPMNNPFNNPLPGGLFGGGGFNGPMGPMAGFNNPFNGFP